MFGLKPDWWPAIEGYLTGSRFRPDMQDLSLVEPSEWDLIVPLTIEDQDLLDELNLANVAPIIPYVPQALSMVCDDKLMLNQRLISLGFAALVPDIYGFAPTDPGRYPLIKKPRRRSWGYGCSYVRSPEEAEPSDPQTEFLQSVVSPGDEWAAHLSFHGGELIFAHSVHHHLAQSGLILGNQHSPVRSVQVAEVPFLDQWLNVTRALGILDGTICIDFAIMDGKPYLYEINPRIGGSLLRELPRYLESQLAARDYLTDMTSVA